MSAPLYQYNGSADVAKVDPTTAHKEGVNIKVVDSGRGDNIELKDLDAVAKFDSTGVKEGDNKDLESSQTNLIPKKSTDD